MAFIKTFLKKKGPTPAAHPHLHRSVSIIFGRQPGQPGVHIRPEEEKSTTSETVNDSNKNNDQKEDPTPARVLTMTRLARKVRTFFQNLGRGRRNPTSNDGNDNKAKLQTDTNKGDSSGNEASGKKLSKGPVYVMMKTEKKISRAFRRHLSIRRRHRNRNNKNQVSTFVVSEKKKKRMEKKKPVRKSSFIEHGVIILKETPSSVSPSTSPKPYIPIRYLWEKYPLYTD